MKKLYPTLGLLMCITSQIHAGDYAIQLSASKSPQLTVYKPLEKFGNLYTTTTDNGFIRTRLGTLHGKKIALETLAKVHAAGYPNAFLVNADTNVTAKTPTPEYNSQNAPEWQMLNAEQQANIVNLDGVLHIKEGDNFTPLSKVIKK